MNSSQAAPCWAVVEKALAAAQECEGATRARYLQDLSQDDPAVHAEVCALLSAVERSTVGGYLNGPRLTAKEPALPAHLPPGRVLGAWQLQDLIGRGGMGEVYLCERADGAFDMRAAVKILRAEARQHLERFAAERNIVAKLDHPGIARLLDGGLVDERPYMVMEYVAGLPINDYVRGHSLQLEAVLSLLAQVCAAVTHAHERGVIHRDLKPGNILVTADGRTKLVDFGIAKFVEPTNREAVTSTQAPMTVAYSAPEQLQGKTPTVATDVHGLGVVFYELLTGTLPWGEVDGVAISVLMQRIQRETPPPASARADPGDGRVSPIPASLLSGDLDAILRRALQKDPALRYPSVAELAADLARFRRGEAVAARATGTPPRLEVAERRQISVVCCDLDDATALSEDHDPEALHEGRVALHNTMTTLVEQYGGHLTEGGGGGALVYFGYPKAHDDDAERAVRCGLAILAALAEPDGARPLKARVAVHTGPVIVGPSDGHGPQPSLSTGATTKLAARVAERASPQSLLISPATHALVRGLFQTQDLGPQSLRGLPDPISIHRVVAVRDQRSRLEARASLSPFVGRRQELALLEDRCERAAEGEGQALLISAEPGVGKSRLLLALRESLADSSLIWQEWHCAALNEHSAFAPIIDALRRDCEITADTPPTRRLSQIEGTLRARGLDLESAVPLLAPLLNLPLTPPYVRSPYGPELKHTKTLDLLNEWVLASARAAPTVLIVEDLHWADPATRDTLGALLERLPGTKLMLLLTARPEFRLPWDISQIHLQPLRTRESAELLAGLPGSAALSEGLQNNLITRAGGVPLFLEELVSHLLEADGLNAAMTTADIPATLQDSLAARIDRLAETRPLLQLCAAIGREIPYALLLRVADLDEPTLQQHIERLCQSLLISRQGQGAEARLQFKHSLIQDAAYNAILVKHRQSLHRRIADTLVQDFPAQVEAHPASVAEHYACAQMPEQAVPHFYAAAELARQRSALDQAIALCDRALSLLDGSPAYEGLAEDTMNVACLALRATAYLYGYASDKARPYIDRCETLAPQAAPSLALGFYHILRWAHVYFGGQDALDVALEEIASAQDQDDPTFLCYGYFHAATSYWRRSELAPALAYSRKAEDAYDPIMGKAMAQAGDFDPLVLTYITRGGYLNQLGRLHEADACLRQAHDWAREIGHPQIEATVWSYAVMMLGIRECTGAQLLECAAKARELSEKYGYQEGLDLALLGRASGLLRLGRPAESCTAYETYLAQTHARTYMQASLAWVELALARSRSDQAEPAHAAIDEAFRLIAQNADRLWDVEACRARAELALRHGGDVQTAEHDLRQAIALADSRDNRLSSLRAACTLSELLRDSGRCEEAIALLTDKLQAMPDQDHPELAPAQRLLRALQSGPTLPRDDRPSLPQGRWQRGLQVAGLASRVAAGRLRQAALAPWHAASKRDEARLRHRRDEATDVAQTLGQMRGVAMKLGQIASFATPGLNPEMQAALESLQADAPPMDFDQACRVLSEELGAPLEALFSEFDETPVAAASIGQVHRARCHDGRELAVKIQYPGLAETIRSDLANTAAVTRLAKLVMPALEPGPVVQELRERLGEELDYRHEARCQQLFYELWNGHPSLRVPRVIPELSGSRVLTAEFVHGRKLGALGAEDPALKTRVGESILRFAVGSSVRFSVFNGDPHPGNYLVDAQGKVCLLDFGCTKFWSESFAEPWMRICHALREADFAAVNEAAVETGIMKPRAGYDPQLACEYIALLQSLYTRRGVHRMSYAETHQLLRQAARPSGRFRSVARYLNMPRDMVLMYRFLFGVNTILADLKASGPWRDIFGEYYYRDPPATPLGEEEQAFRARWYAERKLNPAARYARTFEGFRPCAPFAYELWARS